METSLTQSSQAYILFKSMQAATAMKQRIETFGGSQQYEKKFAVAFSNPYTNPFKTIPKDGPMRNNTSTTNIRPNSASVQSYTGGGYRGGRGGGFNNRGGAMSGMPNYNRGGFQQPMAGFQGAGVGGFSSMGGMPPIGGFQARRGMVGGGMRGGGMGMRGGRGGMMGLPVNMGMGSMGMGMGMPQMGGMGMQSMSHSVLQLLALGPWVPIMFLLFSVNTVSLALLAFLPTLIIKGLSSNVSHA